MPEGTLTLPGGLKVKKNVAIGIGVAAVGIGAYAYYRNKQAQSTAQVDTGAQIDPQTGYPYGSQQDTAALAQLSGQTLPTANNASFVGGQIIGYDQYGNPIYGSGAGGFGGSGFGGPGGFSSNAQWTQAAESLMGSTGADAIAAALGKYLLGADLTEDQVTIVQQAIAAEGFPPVPGPNGFPPSYKTAQPPSGGGGGGTANPAVNPVQGLHAVARTTQIDVSWKATPNATSYLVKAHLGSRVVDQQSATGTSITLHNLRPKTAYRITVWAQPGKGSTASTTAKTN